MTLAAPEPVAYALERLRRAGYGAYLAGGCVRDYLMGVEPKDYDIATSASPDETLAAFSGDRLLTEGAKHGTVALVRGGMRIEMTAFRVDGPYADRRRPDSVTFSRSLADDAARRDFTMNALYWGDGGLIDLVGGERDISARLIRCVGDPSARFREDALRILRALRFSSTLGFGIEGGTARAIASEAESLRRVSRERIRGEMLSLLLGAGAEASLREWGAALDFALGGLRGKLGEAGWEAAARRVGRSEPTIEARLAALFADDPDSLGSLLLPKKTEALIRAAISARREAAPPDRRCLRSLASSSGFEAALLSLGLKLCEAEDEAPIRAAIDILRSVRADGDCVSVGQLKIRGSDLARYAAEAREIGAELNRLLRLVMDDAIPNERGALMGEARFAKRGREERMGKADIIYREMGLDGLRPDMLGGFIRRQEVAESWREVGGRWQLVANPYVEDWDEDALRGIVEGDFARALAEGGSLSCALAGDRIVGFCLIGGARIGAGGKGLQMAMLHVSADYRGRGIGRALFGLGADSARSSGAATLAISANSSKETQAFYRAMGCANAEDPIRELVEREPFDVQMEYIL